MISESQLRELLAQKTETRNLDCKESLNWNKAGNDEKCELVKDILAFMNTQDGGTIIFGIRNSTLEPVGLSQADFTSFDTTKVNDFLQRYTDPPAACEVQKLSLDRLNIVVIGVPEFKDVPIICKKDANSSRDSSKLILKAGGLYIRTEKATSVLVSSAEEMRDLMSRALYKRGDQVLSSIRYLVSGNPVPRNQEVIKQDLTKYETETKAALEYFKEVLPADFEKNGYWQLVAMPETYNRERIPDLTSVVKGLLEAEVSLRGWNFPHTDKDTKSNFSDGRQSYTIFAPFGTRYIEAYRAYQSGLFIWRGAYREDAADFVKKYGKAFSFVNVIYEITEMFVFLKRYYERVAPETMVPRT